MPNRFHLFPVKPLLAPRFHDIPPREDAAGPILEYSLCLSVVEPRGSIRQHALEFHCSLEKVSSYDEAEAQKRGKLPDKRAGSVSKPGNLDGLLSILNRV